MTFPVRVVVCCKHVVRCMRKTNDTCILYGFKLCLRAGVAIMFIRIILSLWFFVKPNSLWEGMNWKGRQMIWHCETIGTIGSQLNSIVINGIEVWKFPPSMIFSYRCKWVWLLWWGIFTRPIVQALLKLLQLLKNAPFKCFLHVWLAVWCTAGLFPFLSK